MSDRNVLIAVGIAVALVSAIIMVISPGGELPPLTTRSEQANGAMALRLWLEESGYTVGEVAALELANEDALFILGGGADYTLTEARHIQRWVQQGNTLVLAPVPYTADGLLDVFDVMIDPLPQTVEMVSLSAPTMLSPAVDTLQLYALGTVITERPDAVVHMHTGSNPVVVSIPEGSGTVWIISGTAPFTNLGLNDPISADFVTNLVQSIGGSGVVAFDESRHGFGAVRETLRDWLFGTSPGWGVIAALVLAFVFIALRGRCFGQAIPLPQNRLRREPVEYIMAMASLYRGTGQRDAMMNHYEMQLRRKLAHRYNIDARLDVTTLLDTIVTRDPNADVTSLRAVFTRLHKKNPSEADMLHAARDVVDYLEN